MIPDFLRQILAPERWPVFAFVTARLGGLMLSAPLWSTTLLPRMPRAAITVALAAVMLPVCPATPIPERMLDLPLPLAMELVVGLAIGLTAAVIVQGVTLAGEVIAMQMGLALSSALSPMPDAQVSGPGQIKYLLALMIYLGVGGHLVLLKGLADSFRVLPPGMPMDFEGGARASLPLLSVLFSCAVRAAAPVMVTLVLANIAVAILSRAVPQINAMMVAFPFTIGLGLVVLGALLPVIASTVGTWMDTLPAGVASVVGGFRASP